MLTLVTRERSGFYSVQSTLEYKVVKEDKDARFTCEVSYLVPGAIRRAESSGVNISVHCEVSMVVRCAGRGQSSCPSLCLQTRPRWWSCGRTRPRDSSERGTLWSCVARATAAPLRPSCSIENK